MIAAPIHIAYAYDRRNRCYRARGYVGDHRKPMHSIAVAIGDTAEEALAECVDHINRMHDRSAVARPSEVIRHGKVAAIVLDHLAF